MRVVSSLRCRCQTVQEVVNGSGYNQFDPVRVLGFVLDAAVLPWVESPCLLDAVRGVAQVHAFRSYSSIHHKKIYRETTKKGNFS